MQTENSGSSQNKRQEDTKKVRNSEAEVDSDAGGNEYTAAFILYCQKTLDSFRRIYGDTYASEAGPGFGSSFGSGLEPESEDDEFELEQDDVSESDDYKEREALRELSEQFEQMLKAKTEFEDDEFELEQDDGSESDDHKEKEELEEFFEQFEQMFGAKTEFEDDEFELEQDDGSESDDHKEKEEPEEFFEQFEQMLKNETEPGNNSLELEQGNKSQSRGYKGKEALKELLGQFEQMLDAEAEPDNEEFELEQDEQSQSNGYKQKEKLKELFEHPEQIERTTRGAGALYHATDESDSRGEEKTLHNVTGASSQGLNDEEIDQALSGVGEVVKSAKENLGIVEAFWEESESERAKLLTKAEITQEEFEQIITRVGSHLYDVKDCLEGWGDLSMLPETYEQLLLANNELSGIFEKMYGKSTTEVLDKRKGLVSEEEDDWELDDDDDDWELDDDDDMITDEDAV